MTDKQVGLTLNALVINESDQWLQLKLNLNMNTFQYICWVFLNFLKKFQTWLTNQIVTHRDEAGSEVVWIHHTISLLQRKSAIAN